MTDANRPTDPVSLPMDVKRKLLAARDALTVGDLMEAHHQIYSIASPNFNKLADEVWTALESPTPDSPSGARERDDEAAGQIEHLDRLNNRLTQCLQALMRDLAYLLDADQFNNIEARVMGAGVPYPPIGTIPRYPGEPRGSRSADEPRDVLLGRSLRQYAHDQRIAACGAWSGVAGDAASMDPAKCDLAAAHEERLKSAIDELADLSRPSAEPAGGQWQPIETAPRDETDILVAGGTCGNECVSCEFHGATFRGVAIAHWDKREQWFSGGECDYYHPTHWMPIPSPPETKDGKL